MTKIVEINELRKNFGDLVAVDDISLAIEDGEVFGLLGPNGAGKSTTINILCGLLKKDKGDIRCFGLDNAKEPMKVKQQIGVVPQDIAIYEDLKAVENVKFFASLYGLKGKDLNKKALDALEFVGLLDRKDDYPKNFSGGMKRRLNIACAIAHRPKLIIMDEPTVGIDPQSRNHILDSVRTLNKQGSTIIYTTHYMEEVEAVCTKIGIIDHGKLIALGTKKELESIVTDVNTIEILVDINANVDDTQLFEIPGVVDIERKEEKYIIECSKESDCISEIINEFKSQGAAIRGVSMTETSLETVFLALTGRRLRD